MVALLEGHYKQIVGSNIYVSIGTGLKSTCYLSVPSLSSYVDTGNCCVFSALMRIVENQYLNACDPPKIWDVRQSLSGTTMLHIALTYLVNDL